MEISWSTPRGPVQLNVPEGLTAIEFDEAVEAINVLLRTAGRRVRTTQRPGDIEYESWVATKQGANHA